MSRQLIIVFVLTMTVHAKESISLETGYLVDRLTIKTGDICSGIIMPAQPEGNRHEKIFFLPKLELHGLQKKIRKITENIKKAAITIQSTLLPVKGTIIKISCNKNITCNSYTDVKDLTFVIELKDLSALKKATEYHLNPAYA